MLAKIRKYLHNEKKFLILIIVITLATFVIVTTLSVFGNNIFNGKIHYFKVGIARWGNSHSYSENIQSFKTAMNESGFVEGKNIEYIIESSELDKTKQKEIIQEFIDKKVDLIYSLTTPGTLIAKNMTKDIPIVFSIVTYPLESGIAKNLEHSGNILTGTRNYISTASQLDLFDDIVHVKKIGFVHRYGEPNSMIQFNEMKEFGNNIGITVIEISPKDLEEVPQKIQNVIYDVDALYQACDTLIQNGGEEIAIELANKYKKPTFSCNLEGVKNGALFGDVANFSKIGYLAGQKAALVLNGAQPNDIVIESPTKGDIVVNLKTANYLGIKIPQHILSIADKVFR